MVIFNSYVKLPEGSSLYTIAPQKFSILFELLGMIELLLSHHYWDDSVFDTDTSQLKQPAFLLKNQRVGFLGPRSPKYVLSTCMLRFLILSCFEQHQPASFGDFFCHPSTAVLKTEVVS